MNHDNADILRYFVEQYERQIHDLPCFNILIAGKTGVGKSTLINAVFREELALTGVGVPVTRHLQKISKAGMPLCIYDTKGLELKQETQDEIRQEILDEIAKPSRQQNLSERMHICWYCINQTSNRIEEVETAWIRELAEYLPVIVVLTQSIGDNYLDLFHAIEAQTLPIEAIVPVLAKAYPIGGGHFLPVRGLQQLVDRSIELVPEALQLSFVNAQKVDMRRKLDRANKAVLGYASSAFATGFTPIPFSDAALLVPMQIGMIAHLTTIFGLPLDRTLLTSLISTVLGTGGATALGHNIVGSLAKLIPGAGQITGGFINGSTAAALTAALGYAYNQVMFQSAASIYKTGGINTAEFKTVLNRFFRKELNRSKEYIMQGKGKQLPPPELSSQDENKTETSPQER